MRGVKVLLLLLLLPGIKQAIPFPLIAFIWSLSRSLGLSCADTDVVVVVVVVVVAVVGTPQPQTRQHPGQQQVAVQRK